MRKLRLRRWVRREKRRSASRWLAFESIESRVLLAAVPTFYVTNTGDNGGVDPAPGAGTGTLRQAIIDANATSGPADIQFEIPASTAALLNVPVPGFDPTSRAWTITLGSALPTIEYPVTIDGYSEANVGVPFRYPSAISSAVQSVDVEGVPTGGTFTLSTVAPLPVGTTVPIAYDALPATVQTDLEAILGTGNVSVTGISGAYTITFEGTYESEAIPDVVPASALTGGTNPDVIEATTTIGGVAIADPTEITSVPNTTAALDGNNAQPLVIVQGSGTGGATGFTIDSSDSILRGLIIDGFGVGVSIPGPSDQGDLVQGNFIGQYFLSQYDATTGALLPAPDDQVFTGVGNSLGVLLGSTNATIGGDEPQDDNVIVGNDEQGVSILAGAEGNQVLGNQIGIAGPSLGGVYVVAPNKMGGVLVAASSNVIGGAASDAGNLISGNKGDGVEITGAATTEVQVLGNYIGVGPGGGYLFGSGNPGNQEDGVLVQDAYSNTIGGSATSAGNVISSNGGMGVEITGAPASGNTVANNIIGLTAGGSTVEGNAGAGIFLDSADNMVGPGNVISANLQGIVISGASATGNEVLGNLVGTGSGGQTDLGNALQGILIENASDNSIVGTSSNVQVISGNNDGVSILGASSTGNTIEGNFIGTDMTGKLALGNSQSGILIDSGSGNTIGGTLATARNVISANNWGVTVEGATAENNLIQGNYIGTDVSGTLPLGNEVDGVLFTQSASNNQVGGVAVAAGNTIAFNLDYGVEVQSGTGNEILSNLIFSNTTLGISIAGDSATSGGTGPNDLQSYPVLTSAVTSSTGTDIEGTLTSTAGTSFLIQFFSLLAAGSAGGPSAKLLGAATVTTPAGAGNTVVSIMTTVATSIPAGTLIVATATNLSTDDTSELSTNVSGLTVTAGFVVTNTGDNGGVDPAPFAGTGTLRQAIVDANEDALLHTFNPTGIPDQITFAIPGSGPFVIDVLSPLPVIDDDVDINGYSEYNYMAGTIPTPRDQTTPGAPLIQLSGLEISQGAGLVSDGLDVAQVNCWIGGLILTGFSGSAISLLPSATLTVDQGAIGDVVWGNEIGVGGANGYGVSISSSHNTIGGTSAPTLAPGATSLGTVNIIQGNTDAGISTSGTSGTGNFIDGNEILDNQGDGILVESSDNLIGETAGNLIAGNRQNGIEISGAGGSPAQGNVVQKNMIGVDVDTNLQQITPTSTQPNSLDGILLYAAQGTQVVSNVIGDNAGDGVDIEDSPTSYATGNVVQGNLIDFNLDGVFISSASNTIGGTSSSVANTIVDNQRNGITITSMTLSLNNVELGPIGNNQPTGNVVQGNSIGVDAGSDDGNTLEGVLIADAPDNTIGGTATGAGNVISGNNIGVRILNAAATGNVVEGNLIGTASDGVTLLPNAVDGVRIENAPGNTIGGTATGAGNEISGNTLGVLITGAGATGNLLEGNAIGTNLAGTVSVRNTSDGIQVAQGASNNTIGGTATGAGNTIADNLGYGVNIVSGTGNSILSNLIYGNGMLGISILGDSATSTSAGGGPNDLQSYPALTSAIVAGSITTIEGTLTSTASTSYLIQFFALTAAAPGIKLVGATTVTTAGGTGNTVASILATLSTSVAVGTPIVATATDLTTGDTSAFSPASSLVTIAGFIVTNTNSSGAGSLSQAISMADSPSSTPTGSIPNQILFEIPGPGPFVIRLTSTLTITNPVDINGYSEYNFLAGTVPQARDQTVPGVPLIQLDGSEIPPGVNPSDGLDVAQVNCWIGGLLLTGFSGAAINLLPAANPMVDQGSIGDVVWGNQIGVGGGNGVGIAVSSSNNVIGASTSALGNVIEGSHTAGIKLSGTAGTGNIVDGNQVLDNQGDGILVESSDNLIGETAGNLIAGNQQNGIHIVGTAALGAQGNVIQNNLIGVNAGTGLQQVTPTSSEPNLLDGIRIDDARGNVVESNVIGNNAGDGVDIENVATMSATGNIVQGNLIDYNLDGVYISSANNTIGGTTSELGNTIVDNERNGITITSKTLNFNNVEGSSITNNQPTGNVVEGNLIGTDSPSFAAQVDEGNTLEGILIADAPDNTIGGAASGAGNVISGNNIGVRILNAAATGNLLEGNLIGTASDGLTVLPNSVDGVQIENAPGNTIGGTATGAGNEISGNTLGVLITGAGATGNLLEGNAIGSNPAGTVAVRNTSDGVQVTQGALDNTIGGTFMGAANIIAFNLDNGVDVIGNTTTGNSILSNSIFGNGLLGIDLGDDGVTPNHSSTTLSTGPNDFQNYPVVTSIVSGTTNLTIGGTLNSVASTTFLIQLYLNPVATSSGYGPGQTLIGSATVTTNASGSASFSATVAASLSVGNLVSATATNLSTGDTSEFSLDFAYQLTTQFSAATYSVAETGGQAVITVTRSNGSSVSDINFATGGGTAVPGVNYAPTSGTLDFAVGQTSASFNIPVIHDFEITGPLTVGIALSSPTEGSLGTPSTAQLTIEDVDTPGSLEFSGATLIVSPGATVANVTVSRAGGAGGTVTVAYASGGGTAVPGTDYTSVSGVLSFAPGATSETIAVPILSSIAGSDKTFSLMLSTPTGGATVGNPATLTVTIAPPGSQGLPIMVTNTNDSGPGSLRQAIIDANANSGPADVQFAIPASTSPLLNVPVPGFDPTTHTWTINLASALPPITNQVTIDGYSQANTGVPFRYPNAISSAVQLIAVAASGGTFTLSTAAPLPAGTTAPIPFNALGATIQVDLDAILGPGSVSVMATNGGIGVQFFVTFTGAYQSEAIPDLIPNGAGLTGSLVSVQEATTIVGGVAIAGPTNITSAPNSNTALDGDNAQPLVIVNGSSTGGATGFVLDASDSILRGLIIDGFGVGVSIPGPSDQGDLVQGNFIGQYLVSQYDPTTGSELQPPDSQALEGSGNSLQGILLGSTNATIGGADPQDANVVSGNGQQGVSILPGAVGNLVEGNQIGIAGPSAQGLYFVVPNGSDGVLIAGAANGTDGASSNVVSDNLISGNLGDGVHITGAASTENQVEGNYIGIAPGGGFQFGQGAPGNLSDGVLIDGAPDNTIGGTSASQRNVISANTGVGVEITGVTATGNVVANNYVGLTASGTAVLGNANEGVVVLSANNVVGPGNVISGNLRGVLISGAAASGNQVTGNLIGTDSTGQADLGNAEEGVLIENASDNSVLGNGSGSQVISGNNNGVSITGAASTGNVIDGNFIGTNLGGTAALGNSQNGILISAAPDNTVGGTSSTTRNLISANDWGIQITGTTATNNLVQGNDIGTDTTGKLALGNEIDGVLLTSSASNNLIGGSTASEGNTIAFNSANGVEVQSGTGNSIESNALFGNGLLAIRIAGDSATSGGTGPNNLQSFPVLTAAVTSSTSTSVQGTLTSVAGTSFLIQFFSITPPTPTAGPTASLVGATTVTTNSMGMAQILAAVPTSVTIGTVIVATATNLTTGDTSELSADVSGTGATIGFSVVNTNDSGPGSLRAAILAADAQPDSASAYPATSIPDQITFAIPGTGPFVIHLLTPLPQITDQVDINGYSQYNFMNGTLPQVRDQTVPGVPLIQLDGLEINPSYSPADGLDVAQVNCWIGGLILTGFSGSAINLLPSATTSVDQGAIGDVVWGNEIGVGSANGYGVSISSSNNVIGGSTPPGIAAGASLGTVNLIENSTIAGIRIWDNPEPVNPALGNTGTGNVIDGNEVLDNQGDGVLIETSNNLIGETAGNLIAGNQGNGIHIVGATPSGNLLPAQGNVIQKNLIGVSAGTAPQQLTPTSTQPNVLDGIRIDDARGNVVLSNVIGDNGGDGVNIENVFTQNATANVVQGNTIDYNLDGINVSSADNTIGGTTIPESNTIVENQRNGITITSELLNLNNVETSPIANAQPTGNVVTGNAIGTNFSILADTNENIGYGNTLEGILIADASGNTIGGTASGAGNVISGNNIGVRILNLHATGNLLEGNLIGTMSDGVTVLPNAVDGVLIDNAPGNTIGGIATGAGNVISGNNYGLAMSGSGATANQVQGNAIGTNMTGTTAVRNARDGVEITLGASNNTIGGTVAGAGNIIADNLDNGVNILSGTGNSVLSNQIFGDGGLGISILGDSATSSGTGPNDLQSFPMLTSVLGSGTSTIIRGTLQSVPSTSFLLQFYSVTVATASGYGPGNTLLGSVTVTTDSSGEVSFSTAVPGALTVGTLVSATATNVTTGDTSAFSLDSSSTLQFVVTNTNDSGPGSLRQAIIATNAETNVAPSIPNEIDFAIAGTGPFTIHLLSPLPEITNPVNIDGYTEPGSALNNDVLNDPETDVATLMIQIDGALAGAGADGLEIATVGCSVSGLMITGFSGAGIALVPGASTLTSGIGNTIEGNFIGVNSFDTHSSSLVLPGENPLANGVGIAISSSNNYIGGTLPPSRNVIQGNASDGVVISGASGIGNTIEGDYVLDNNGDGILITSSNNYIGQAIGLGPAGAGDIISGNAQNGVHIAGPAAQGNVIVNSEIGTDVGRAGLLTPIRGMNPRPNLLDGILIQDAPGNIIGGVTANAGNVIAANGLIGISIQNFATQDATGNIVEGNKIGYNIRAGIISLMPNLDGINISSANNTIGGTVAAAQNIIIANLRNGITISSMLLDGGNTELGAIPNADPTGNVVEGNFIGTQGGGDRYGNALDGILIDAAADNTIGGMATGAANVISANNDGITIYGPASAGNLIQGNDIGTMSDGMTVMGNAIDGITINNAQDNTIGGTAMGAGNVISGNNWGVRLTGADTTGTLIEGNFIGTNSSVGTTTSSTASSGSGSSTSTTTTTVAFMPVRNAVDGILITQGASDNMIGGTAAGAGNVIAYNVGNGVNVLSGTENSILTNQIFGNNLLGINIPGDSATSLPPGPNDLQSFPTLTSVASSGTGTSIQGNLQSLPNTTYLIQFFSNTSTTTSGYGQGQTPIGSVMVTTDPVTGMAAFATTTGSVVPQNLLVSATATVVTGTNQYGDTSAFSQVISSTPISVEFAAASYAVDQAAGSITVNVMRMGNPGAVVTVAYATGGGTAQAGVNYTTTTGTLTFNPGVNDESFVVPIISNSMVGPNTTVNLTLSNPTGGATLGANNPVTLTIQNNNQLTMEFNEAAYSVAETAGTATITVTRNSSSTTSEVEYATGGGTAVAGVNYTASSGILVFNPGQSTATFTIPVIHDPQVTGPLTVGIALSSPTGGFLGTPSTAQLTINDVDKPGMLEFAGATLTVSATAGAADVTVLRTGGIGGTVSVSYSTGGGDAVPGVDYTPVSGILTFAPGQMSETIAVPILNDPAANDLAFGLVLGNPTGGATLGTPNALVITIAPPGIQANVVQPNAVGPVITDLHLLNNGAAITAIVLDFNRALDPSRAVNLANYGSVLRVAGPGGVFGTYDNSLVPLAAATYDSTTDSVTLTPATPLPLNVLYQITINQNANTLTGAGVADTTGALLNAGTTGGPYVASFALGTNLAYVDATGNNVSLKLTGGGLLELRLGSSSDAQQLRILDAVPGKSTLTGQVHPGAPGATGTTPIAALLGAGGVKTHLKSFIVGTVSTVPVSQGVPPKKAAGHKARHAHPTRKHHQ